MVTIYHGSKAKIKGLKNPEEFKIGKRKDFGYGFYCTRDLEQADRWANRRGTSGFIYSFYYDEESAKKDLNVKTFELDDEWLDFIILNRSKDIKFDYDIVEGPMADDEIYNHINDFLDGRMSREEFWGKALFKYPTNQICFLSGRSIKYLKEAK